VKVLCIDNVCWLQHYSATDNVFGYLKPTDSNLVVKKVSEQ